MFAPFFPQSSFSSSARSTVHQMTTEQHPFRRPPSASDCHGHIHRFIWSTEERALLRKSACAALTTSSVSVGGAFIHINYQDDEPESGLYRFRLLLAEFGRSTIQNAFVYSENSDVSEY